MLETVTKPLMKPSTSSTGLVTVERQFDGLIGRPSNAVAAGTSTVPRIMPAVHVGTLMFTTDWNNAGPARPSRN